MLDAGGLVLLTHLMSAGRLQLFPKRATMKDRTMRVGLRLSEDRELRTRSLALGADAYLTKKECASGRLLGEVAAVLSRRRVG